MNISDTLQLFHNRLLGLAASFSFDKQNSVDLHRIALYGSMLELTGSICALVKANAFIGLPSLFRSFLEAKVELANLLADRQYIQNMTASYIDHWLKVLKEAKTTNNPYLASISQLADLDAQIEKEEAELRRLVSAGRGPLNVYQRFERANMAQEYRSLYDFLSCDAHSNIRALVSRHIKFGAKDFEVVYYKDEPLQSFESLLDSTAGLLLESSVSMHKLYGLEKVSDVEGLLTELKGIRET